MQITRACSAFIMKPGMVRSLERACLWLLGSFLAARTTFCCLDFLCNLWYAKSPALGLPHLAYCCLSTWELQCEEAGMLHFKATDSLLTLCKAAAATHGWPVIKNKITCYFFDE